MKLIAVLLIIFAGFLQAQEMKSLTHRSGAYSLKYPAQWTVQDLDKPTINIVTPDDTVAITISAYKCDPGNSDRIVEDICKVFSGYRAIKSFEPFKTACYSGREGWFKVPEPESSRIFYARIITTEEKVVFITANGLEADFEPHKDMILKTIGTITL